MLIEKRREVNKGSLKCSLLVHVPEWGLHMWVNYFQKDGGKNWFSYPALPYENKDGEKKYHWLAYFDPEIREKFEKKLRDAMGPNSFDYNVNNDELPF